MVVQRMSQSHRRRIVEVVEELQTLIYDSFTDTNGVLLPNHAPDINVPESSWVEQLLTWDIQSNCAAKIGGWGAADATIETGGSDVKITATLTPIATNVISGIVFRFVDTDNCWFVLINGSLDTFQLIERKTGEGQNIRDSASVVTGIGTYVMELTAIGDSLVATLDGENELSYTSSSHQTATKHGVYGNHASAQIADFLVQS